MGILQNFVQRAGQRTRQNLGFDWVTVVLPIVMELIQQCLNNRASLASFAEGDRRPLQVAALRVRCRQAARANGAGAFRAMGVGNSMADAILAELDATARNALASSDGGDVYQDVLNEVAEVMG